MQNAIDNNQLFNKSIHHNNTSTLYHVEWAWVGWGVLAYISLGAHILKLYHMWWCAHDVPLNVPQAYAKRAKNVYQKHPRVETLPKRAPNTKKGDRNERRVLYTSFMPQPCPKRYPGHPKQNISHFGRNTNVTQTYPKRVRNTHPKEPKACPKRAPKVFQVFNLETLLFCGFRSRPEIWPGFPGYRVGHVWLGTFGARNSLSIGVAFGQHMYKWDG